MHSVFFLFFFYKIKEILKSLALPWELQQVSRAEIRKYRVVLQSTEIKMSQKTDWFLIKGFSCITDWNTA